MQRPQEYSVQEVAELLRSNQPLRLVDVREPVEWDVVHLDGAQLLTQELVDEMLAEWPRDATIICYCHHGVRSLNAALFLQSKGFTAVASMAGGIDAWSREIDPSLPRY